MNVNQNFTWKNEEYSYLRTESNGRIKARHNKTGMRISLPKNSIEGTGNNTIELKTLKTIEDFEQLIKGQRIHISNGEKEPPKHHTKKHKSWYLRNYVGFVYRFGYSAGRYEIAVDSTGTGILVNVYDMNQMIFQVEVKERVLSQ